MIPASSVILCTRQLAALRRSQWSTLDAVGFIAAALPPGELRTTCEQALAAMRGGKPAEQWMGPLEQTLSRAEAATAETFEALAESLEAREQVQTGLWSAAGMARLLFVGPLLLGALFGWVVLPSLGSLLGPLPVPAATALSLELLGLLKWAGVPLAVAAWLVVPAVVSRFAPGARQFGLAAQLLEFVSTGEASPRRFKLEGAAERFFRWREGKAGAAVAARELAEQLRVEGWLAVKDFDRLAPIAVLALGASLFGFVLLPLFLPIFSLAGAIK